MKLSTSQHQVLRAYLDKELTYRGTFDELYDHISSGLESAPEEGASFDETLKNYVTKEFGGVYGLHTIEKQYRATVLAGMNKQYLVNIYHQFRFPQVIVLAVIAAAVYLVFSAAWFDKTWYWALFFVAPFAISGIKLTHYIAKGYWRGVKASVKTEGFTRLKYAPATLIIAVGVYNYFFLKDTPANWLSNVSPLFATIIFIAYALHILSYYRMYAGEFKVATTK